MRVKFKEKDLPLIDQFNEFTIDMIKAMVQTGYYSSAHPLASKATEHIFEKLQGILQNKNELLYMSISVPEKGKGDISVDGLLSETVHLKDSFYNIGMGQHFISKFLDYFDRNYLASFSIKNRIDRQEFEKFIEILVKHHRDDESQEASEPRERFSDVLLKNKIFNIVAVHRDELLSHHRVIPWRVKLALSRLRKDLKVIPLYTKASSQEMATVKTQTIADIVRPLRQVILIKELLLNCDLVAAEGLDFFRGWDIEQAIISYLDEELAHAVSWAIIEDLQKEMDTPAEKRTGISQEREARCKSILRKIAIRFFSSNSEKAHEILEHLFKQKLIRFQELPSELQYKIFISQIAEEFNQDNPTHITQKLNLVFDNPQDTSATRVLLAVFEELCKRQNLFRAFELVQMIEGHPKAQSLLVHNIIVALANPQAINLLVKQFSEHNEKIRDSISAFLVKAGRPAAPYLLDMLSKSENDFICKQIIDTLASMGSTVADLVIAELSKAKQPVRFYLYLIMLIGNANLSEGSQVVQGFLRHNAPSLRREALSTLFKLLGTASESMLINALYDKDHEVRLQAIPCLGFIGSKNETFRSLVIETLRVKKQSEKEADENLQIAALKAATNLGNIQTGSGIFLEAVLGENLLPPSRFGFLGPLNPRARQTKSDRVRAAICKTLGEIGTSQSLPFLEKALLDPDKIIQSNASLAIRKLKKQPASRQDSKSTKFSM